MPNSEWDKLDRQNGFVDPVDWLRNRTPKGAEAPKPDLYTVLISILPGSSTGRKASITFYGINGYYKHAEVSGTGNSVTLLGVPGGRGVKCRIDVDLQNRQHTSYYDQEIYGSGKSVNFVYRPGGRAAATGNAETSRLSASGSGTAVQNSAYVRSVVQEKI